MCVCALSLCKGEKEYYPRTFVWYEAANSGGGWKPAPLVLSLSKNRHRGRSQARVLPGKLRLGCLNVHGSSLDEKKGKISAMFDKSNLGALAPIETKLKGKEMGSWVMF